MPQLLFVYGTLHPDRAPAEMRHAVSHFIAVGQATIPGTLHNLGQYPGVTTPARHGDLVFGSLYALPDGPELLAELDAYEGFDPQDPAGSLFVRVRLTATLPDRSRRRCWVYRYNRPLPAL